MSDFKIEIASVFDRENLVAEIWYNEELVCEISKERNDFEIEFYQTKGKTIFNLASFILALDRAKSNLKPDE